MNLLEKVLRIHQTHHQKQMVMELKTRLPLLALVVCTLMGCSSTGNLPLVTDNFPNFDINGQWAILGENAWKNEIMFDFRQLKNAQYQLKVSGKKAQLDSIQVGQQQFIFSYVAEGNQGFSVLGTILSEDQIKLSRIAEIIEGFQPLGKLGKKVYYLQKITEGEPYMLTKAPSRRKSNFRRY